MYNTRLICSLFHALAAFHTTSAAPSPGFSSLKSIDVSSADVYNAPKSNISAYIKPFILASPLYNIVPEVHLSNEISIEERDLDMRLGCGDPSDKKDRYFSMDLAVQYYKEILDAVEKEPTRQAPSDEPAYWTPLTFQPGGRIWGKTLSGAPALYSDISCTVKWILDSCGINTTDRGQVVAGKDQHLKWIRFMLIGW